MAIKVYKFGLLNPVNGWDHTAIDVLYLRNRLWNDLVALEHERRQAYRNLILEADIQVVAVQERLDTIKAERTSLTARKNAMKSKARSRQVDAADIDQALKILNEEYKSLREQAKILCARVKADVKPLATELENKHYENTKQLIKESKLWWCNSATVIAAYEVGRIRAMKEKTELRFRSFDGTGKFGVRRTGGFSLNDLITGKLPFVRIVAVPPSVFEHLSERSQLSRARHHLTMTVQRSVAEDGSKTRHEITWPIIIHRPLPNNSRIKLLYVQRKRVGDRFEWSCSITVDMPEVVTLAIDPLSESACGIDLGFRQVKKDLRIATLADSYGQIQHHILSQDWLESMDYVEAIQSDLSSIANSVWIKLRILLTDLHERPENLDEIITGMLKAGAKTPIRAMRTLHIKLSSEPNLIPDALTLLSDWQKRICRRTKEMHDLRHKLLNRRKDIYRNLAYKIAHEYSTVRIANIQLNDMTKVKRNDGSDTKLADIARKNRNRAALGGLIQYIQQACAKTGASFEKINTTHITRTCSKCGHLNPAEKRDLLLSCGGCGGVYDQDDNAALNYLYGTNT